LARIENKSQSLHPFFAEEIISWRLTPSDGSHPLRQNKTHERILIEDCSLLWPENMPSWRASPWLRLAWAGINGKAISIMKLDQTFICLWLYSPLRFQLRPKLAEKKVQVERTTQKKVHYGKY